MKGLLNHLLLTLRLNLRSKQALVYGYIVPVFFLIAFGSLFKTTPPLLHELGQLLTISVLGGACFGMPTAMVSERERGVWRRYRLLPAATGGLVFSTMVARFLIVASAAILQIAMAVWIYGMPAPLHPLQLAIAFTFVCFAFLGLGLIIAMLAETVPAVQALGQAIFLPMIIIGGVGVPLRILPGWAQTVAGFLPGRYAVDALQACVNRDLHGAPWPRGRGLCTAGIDDHRPGSVHHRRKTFPLGHGTTATLRLVGMGFGGDRFVGRDRSRGLVVIWASASLGCGFASESDARRDSAERDRSGPRHRSGPCHRAGACHAAGAGLEASRRVRGDF